ncbi:hypothetical protein CLAIMM_13300 [Cladophialophora immunda]|nr:hypothetical protein CLAIMM_13300 [Cladophialophora immunda]
MLSSTPSSTASTPATASAVSALINHSAAQTASESLAITILQNLQYQHEWTDLKLHLVCPGHSSPPAPNATAGLIDLDGLKFVHSNPSSRSTSPSRSGSSTPAGSGNSSSSQPSTPPASAPGGTVPVISGVPPKHAYLHPDLQTYLIKHDIQDSEIPVQREFVLPLALGEKWSLARLCGVFDQLPEREGVRVRRPDPTGERRSSGNGTVNGGDSAAPVEGTADGPAPGSGTGKAGRGAAARAVYEHKDAKRVLLGMRAREGGGGDGTVAYYIMQEGEVKPRQNG